LASIKYDQVRSREHSQLTLECRSVGVGWSGVGVRVFGSSQFECEFECGFKQVGVGSSAVESWCGSWSTEHMMEWEGGWVGGVSGCVWWEMGDGDCVV
jgi:hypothetical protein